MYMATYTKNATDQGLEIKEYNLYGNSITDVLDYSQDITSMYLTGTTVSNKKDKPDIHLGNVRATFSRNLVNGEPALQSKADYYPFGMKQPGASVISSYNYRFGYQGRFSEDETGETGYNAFKLRMYDPAIGRWTTIDPARQYWSPYIGMGNNPVNLGDPDGGSTSPIYDKNGNFLGTDDQGLQGDAIIMDKNDFTQGMSHADALNVGTLYSDYPLIFNSNFYSKVDNHYSLLPSRPDYDGIVTVGEAKEWRKIGNGQPLYVDISKIDFKSSQLSIYDFDKAGQTLSVNFFPGDLKPFKSYTALHRPASWQVGRVYGTLAVTLLDPNGTVTLRANRAGAFDRYDFILSNKGAFNFIGYGNGKIHTDWNRSHSNFMINGGVAP